MNIILDDMPKTNIPVEIKDYSSLLLCSFLYQPLFILKNGEFFENLIIDRSTKEIIILEFKEIYWSNGDLLKAIDFTNTLLYILKSKSFLSHYLTFIEGVEEYLDGESEIDEIAIQTCGNTIYIKNKYHTNYYKYLFSTIYLSPLKIVEGSIIGNVTNGKYKASSSGDLLHLLSNDYNNECNVDEVKFIIDKNPIENINKFLKGEADLTSTTVIYGDEAQKVLHYKEFKNKVSNLQLRLEFRKGLGNLKKDVSNHLHNILSNDKYLKSDMNVVLKKKTGRRYKEEVHDISLNRLKLLYADYYPNNTIAYEIHNFYQTKGVDVELCTGDFDFFLREYDDSKYDLILNVISPITKHPIDYFIEKSKYFEEGDDDNYINTLNKWISGKLSKTNLKEFISEHSLILEIGNLKHNYLLKEEYFNNMYIDDNDNIIIGGVENGVS